MLTIHITPYISWQGTEEELLAITLKANRARMLKAHFPLQFKGVSLQSIVEAFDDWSLVPFTGANLMEDFLHYFRSWVPAEVVAA